MMRTKMPEKFDGSKDEGTTPEAVVDGVGFL